MSSNVDTVDVLPSANTKSMCEKSFDDVDSKSVQSALKLPVMSDALLPGEPDGPFARAVAEPRRSPQGAFEQ